MWTLNLEQALHSAQCSQLRWKSGAGRWQWFLVVPSAVVTSGGVAGWWWLQHEAAPLPPPPLHGGRRQSDGAGGSAPPGALVVWPTALSSLGPDGGILLGGCGGGPSRFNKGDDDDLWIFPPSVSGKVVASGQVRPAVRCDGKVPEPSVQCQLCQQDDSPSDWLSDTTVRIQTHSCLSGAQLIKLINYHPKLPFTGEISRGLRVDL